MGPSSPHLAPARKLSTATRIPKSRIATATPISTARTEAADRSPLFSTSIVLERNRTRRRASPAAGRPPLSGEEPRFLHEKDVARFLARDPGLVLLAGERRLVERALLQEIFPLRRLANLLHKVDV